LKKHIKSKHSNENSSDTSTLVKGLKNQHRFKSLKSKVSDESCSESVQDIEEMMQSELLTNFQSQKQLKEGETIEQITIPPFLHYFS